MAQYLKESKPEGEKAAEDAKVRSIVESTLAEIEQGGDKAVRVLSEKFDNYCPADFRLSLAEIEALIGELSDDEVADIKFAQEQVRNFAKAQRESMLDIEVETLPGVILGHKNIPVQSVGCYVPGGKFPMVASAHMSVATASVAVMTMMLMIDCVRAIVWRRSTRAACVSTLARSTWTTAMARTT